jgi:hypothetical protein
LGFRDNLLQSLAGRSVETRSTPVTPLLPIDVPDKVWVDHDGGYYEYSDREPAKLRHLFSNLDERGYAGYNMMNLFYCLPEITGAVHVIAKAVSDATWQLCMYKDDKVVYNDENFNRLFSTPNPLNTIRELIYTAVCIEILTGKQFFYFNKPSTLPDEYKSILTWSNLPANQVTVNMKRGADPYSATELNDLVINYQMGKRVFDPDRVLPIVHMDMAKTVDLNITQSLLKGADKAIKNLLAVYEARGAIYIKRGAMGMWVSKKGDQSGLIALTPKENKEAREEINKDYGVTGNRATVGITSVPMDFIKTSMSLAEMLPFEETLADAVAIYSQLGIPRSMVPSKDQGTFNNVGEDKKEFYGNVIIPWAQGYADKFTQSMKLSDIRRYIKADFSHIAVLQENRKEKSLVDKTNGDVYLQRWLNSVWSLNEWITAIDGVKGTGRLYEEKLLNLTPEEVEQVKAIINFKSTANATQQDTGSKATGKGDQL